MTSISGSGARILAILDLFTEARPDWTPEDIMTALGYSRPTLYRYLKTLKDAGYLATLPGGAFALGPKVTELDFLMRRADPMIRHGMAELEYLAARFPGTAFLSRWYGARLLCVRMRRGQATRGAARCPWGGARSAAPLPHICRRANGARSSVVTCRNSSGRVSAARLMMSWRRCAGCAAMASPSPGGR